MMTKLYWLLICTSLVVLNHGCKTTQQKETPQQFVQRLIPAVQSGNNEEVFKFFVHDQEDIQTVVMHIMGLGPNKTEMVDKQVKEVTAAIEEDRGRMVRKFQRGNLGDWKNVQLDSIALAKTTDISIQEAMKQGIEVIPFDAHFSKDGQPEKVAFMCLRSHTGQLVLINYPSF